jgi:hypothetical protein
MIRQLINEYKEARDATIELKKNPVREVQMFGVIETNGLSIPVYLDPLRLKSIGARFAFAAKVNDQYVIFTDELYVEAPQEVREFVLNHELGHILNGHVEKYNVWKMLKRVLIGLVTIDKMEIEADHYAIEQMSASRVVSSLTYINNRLSTSEINRRIALVNEF